MIHYDKPAATPTALTPLEIEDESMHIDVEDPAAEAAPIETDPNFATRAALMQHITGGPDVGSAEPAFNAGGVNHEVGQAVREMHWPQRNGVPAPSRSLGGRYANADGADAK